MVLNWPVTENAGAIQNRMNTEQVKAIDRIALSAKVVKGFGRGGKQLGCPTANMSAEELGDALVELPTGIYCGWATVSGKGPYKAVASVGWNPFFQNKVCR